MTKKYKIGQTVKVIAPGDYSGESGVIKKDNWSENYPYDVYFENGRSMIYNDEELELDEEKVITKFSGEKDVFESGMTRDSDNGKARYDLVYTPMLKRWGELMARGAVNHGERNWEKANGNEDLNRFKASAFRHFMQWFDGEEDEDHAAAVFFNISGAEMVKAKLNDNKEN